MIIILNKLHTPFISVYLKKNMEKLNAHKTENASFMNSTNLSNFMKIGPRPSWIWAELDLGRVDQTAGKQQLQ